MAGKAAVLEYVRPQNAQAKRPVGFDPTGPVQKGLNLWTYRRIADRSNFSEGSIPSDICLVNWPQNDYWLGNLYDNGRREMATTTRRGRELSLSPSLLDADGSPAPDGKRGWKGLRLRGDVMGTEGRDGLAMAPYIRESRRIKALFTVTENHVGVEARGKLLGKKPGEFTAEKFADSVGTGSYRIDLHPSSGGDNYIDIASLPVPDSAGRAHSPARREPPAGVQEHRHHAHHQRLLPPPPGRVVDRRGGRGTRRFLYREEARAPPGPQGQETPRRLPGPVDQSRCRPRLARRHREDGTVKLPQVSTMPALSYAHGTSSVPLLGETIGENLRRTVERFGDREALVVPHQHFRATYRELWEQVGLAARGLIARGVKTGDRVGVWSPNRFEWVVLQYATARVGAILVNINPAYRAIELEYALKKCGVSLLCLAQRFRQADYLAILAEVRDRCPSLRDVLVIDNDWDELLRVGRAVSEESLVEVESRLQFDDPINIQYTSGTTGFPKGATLTHHNILNNAYFTGERLRYTERDRVCIPVPFYHCFGMVLGNLGATTRGACIVVPGESFDALTTLEAVASERCTSLYGVPTMFIAELEHPRFGEFDLTSLRTGIMAGAPVRSRS